jgi:hypothetical protein
MKLSGNALAFMACALLSVFCLMALLGVGMPGVPVLMLGLAVSIPFWLLVVFPIYLLSGCGKRWSLFFTVVICFLAVAVGFVYSQWTPGVHRLEVGGKVLVENGVATDAYFKDIFATVLAAALLVILCTPVFAWFAKRVLKNG